MRQRIFIAVAALIAFGGVSVAETNAQTYDRLSFEARGTAMVPTFDISDVANLGWGGGAGFGFKATDKVRLMADFDFAVHDTDTSDFNINTLHYMGKVGYDVVSTDKVVLTVNLGVGAVTFAGDLAESYTYPAINAGAKLGVKLSPSVDFLISPQGDIAFSDEAEVGTSNSWVWPFAVGFRINY